MLFGSSNFVGARRAQLDQPKVVSFQAFFMPP
jgi:hypothetical protein